MPEMIESTTIASKYRATLQKPRNCNGSIEFKLRHWEAGGIEGLCLLFELIEIQVSLWIAKVSRFYGTSIFPIPLWHGIRRKAHCSEKSIRIEFSSFAILVPSRSITAKIVFCMENCEYFHLQRVLIAFHSTWLSIQISFTRLSHPRNGHSPSDRAIDSAVVVQSKILTIIKSDILSLEFFVLWPTISDRIESIV